MDKAYEQSKKKLNLLNSVTFNDIRNAIFTLSGYMQLIKADMTDKKLTGFMERIESSLGKITHCLDFAHSYQDMGMKPPRWQDLNQAFLLAISHLDFSKIRHEVKLDGLEIFADPLLEQVVQTLAQNSLTHGGRITEVSLGYARMPDECLKIIYTDDGYGIPEDLKAGIFTRDFLQKKGMDLFLVREILAITGMSIEETGEPSKGARFEITVPKEGYRFRDMLS